MGDGLQDTFDEVGADFSGCVSDKNSSHRFRCPCAAKLDIAEIDRLPQRCKRVASRNKFVGHIPLKIGGDNATHDAIPLNLLCTVQFMPAGNPTGMKMTEPLDVLLDSANEIPLHDLHVVDVVEKFYPRRVHFLNDAYAPRGVVAHVVFMVDLAVEKFDADRHSMVLGNFFDTIQTDDRVFGAFSIGQPLAIAGKSDDVGNASFGGDRNEFAKGFFDFCVIFNAIHGLVDLAATGVAHAANQAMPPGHVELVGIEQVDGFQAQLGTLGAQFIEWDLLVTPAGYGLSDAALARDGSVLLSEKCGGNGSHGDT
jgi:hypothetical protein